MKRTPEEMDKLRDRVLLDRPDLDAIEVRNCPLCGKGSKMRMMLQQFYCMCSDCGCSGPLKNTIDEAKQAWETRK